jgi:hypothetical protein
LLRGALPEAREWIKHVDDLASAAVAGGHLMPASFASLHASIRHERLLLESEIAQRELRFAEAIELANRAARRGDSAGLAPYAEEDAAANARRLGEAQLAAGDAAAAQEPLAAALAIYVKAHHPSSPLLADARAGVARCQVALAAKRRPDAAAGKSPSRNEKIEPGA